MYRHRTRPCAACASPMREVPADVPGQRPVMVDVCECGCVFLEYFDGEPGALARALTAGADDPADRLTVTDGTLSCPDCDTPFELRRYLDEGPDLYRCGACLAVFATPAQLHALADYRLHEAPAPTFLDHLLSLLRGRT